MRLLHAADGGALYERPHPGPARVLLCSTAPSRRLLTDPVVTGGAYRRLTRSAVTAALTLFRADPAGERVLAADRVSVVTILRGGLSFAVEEAVESAGATAADVSFVGTERSPDAPVTIAYERWELGGGPVLAGDILATGGTVTAVLDRLRTAAGPGRQPGAVVLVVIGSAAGVDAVQRYLADLDAAERPQVTIVLLEALFALPAPGAAAPFPRFSFDLLRSAAGATPEYEAARLGCLGSLFERCAVYDGGVRAFTPGAHLDERSAWWATVLRRDVPLAVLAAQTAGLSAYAHPPSRWRRHLPWASQSGVDLDLVHDLGARALRYAETTPTADYVHDRLARGHPP
ncbi:hypothetical protein AWW66_10480 [Micromonospora rosaria]|uniref:Phosphoribosyltransferase domain-containing protein n=1 Tax=Micromonospora rosaria TaxID=47874 RepID=A0A136PUK6_9ACTN|nr:hypothetical protein [Micromonospora rosaria]KXK62063.1 hypothetical protein AWW66_10480 [Micromonospora rosaria]